MLAELKKTYNGKKVFLTGHTGFKGSWLLKVLNILGAEVTGYALAPESDKGLYHCIEGDTLCNSVIADLRDKQALTEAITACQPDFVFHLAAQPLVRLSYDIPVETFEVNAIGTANVLDCLRFIDKPCKAVMITTDKVYHNKEWVYPYRENDRLGGYDPYSASKACTELVISSYRNSFFNPAHVDAHGKLIAVGRAGNVIGGGDWSKDRLVPDIARALAAKQPLTLRNPVSVRPWQHVLEPIAGYLLLGARLDEKGGTFASEYNFGPYVEDTLTVEEMTKLAIESFGEGTYEVVKHANQPHEAGLLKLDINKATNELGWLPKMSARQAINMTMDWYSHYITSPADIDQFTNDQITNFFK